MSQVRGFYDTYHGHELQHLDAVHAAVRQPAGGVGERAVVFLAGDSSLDNKYWFRDNAPATNGYEAILDPPVSRQDIAYWLNKHIADRGLGPGLAALNCSIEESTLNQRACGALRDQDRFLKEHVRAGDTVVVSVGGNDIALAPAPYRKSIHYATKVRVCLGAGSCPQTAPHLTASTVIPRIMSALVEVPSTTLAQVPTAAAPQIAWARQQAPLPAREVTQVISPATMAATAAMAISMASSLVRWLSLTR